MTMIRVLDEASKRGFGFSLGAGIGGACDAFIFDLTTLPTNPELTTVMIIGGLLGAGFAGLLDAWVFRTLRKELEIEWRVLRIQRRPLSMKVKQELIADLERGLVAKLKHRAESENDETI